MTILLVEDHELLGDALARELRLIGEVVWVRSAEQALARLATQVFAVVLSDHNLGDGMTGSDLLAELAARHPAVRRVLMSGDLRMSCPPHAHAFVRKPASRDVLLAALGPARSKE